MYVSLLFQPNYEHLLFVSYLFPSHLNQEVIRSIIWIDWLIKMSTNPA